MDKSIPNTDFKPLNKPISFKSEVSIEYKKYLDEFYTNEWIQNYFKITNNNNEKN